MKKQKITGSILLFITALIWGTTFIAQKLGMDYVDPYTFIALRSGTAFIVLLCTYLVKRKHQETQQKIPFSKSDIVGSIIIGIVLFIGFTTQQVGMLDTDAGKSGFLTSLYIIFVPLLGIFFKKQVNWSIWLLVVVALFGSYLLCTGENFSIGLGEILIAISGIFFALQILLVDKFNHVDAIKLSCIQFFVVFVLAIVPMIINQPTFANIVKALPAILYAGLLSSAIAFTLQIVAQKHVSPTIAALIMSLEAVIATVSGWLILSEHLNMVEIIGCLLIFVAVIAAQLIQSFVESKKNVKNL